jgi:hypothetical protein
MAPTRRHSASCAARTTRAASNPCIRNDGEPLIALVRHLPVGRRRDPAAGWRSLAWREIDWVRVKGRSQRVTIYELSGEEGALTVEEQRVAGCYAAGLKHYRGRTWAIAAD